MADDLDRAIRQIAQMFGGGSQGSTPETPSQADSAPQETISVPQSYTQRNDMMDSLGLMSKVHDMMDTFNHVSDNRINLIRSIQPFLGPTRQQRCNSCIQILKIIAVMSSLSPRQTNPPR